jgi:peroxiredoxin
MQGPWLVAFIVQWVIVLVLTLLVAGILRHLARVEERWNLAAPPISAYELGQRIAEFELPDAAGTKVQSRDLLRWSDGTVMLLVTPSCSACATLLAQVSELVTRRDLALTKTLVMIALGPAGSLERLLGAYPNLRSDQVVALADEDGSVAHQLGVVAIPVGLVVDREGRLIHQTNNPHVANWLYTWLGASPPAEPASRSLVSLIVPAAYKRQ